MHKKRLLLLIDDDRLFCEMAREALVWDNLNVVFAHSLKAGLDICSGSEVDVLLLDQKLPDGRGHDICPAILKYNDRTKIIFTTAYPSFENAVQAIKTGAYDYLSKPVDIEELRLAVSRALRTMELEMVEVLLRYKDRKESDKAVLVGEDGGLTETKKLVDLAASSDLSVIITGETGVGKNVVAKCIHYRGGRSAFVCINCATLPENLIEAELFGYEKGAFTGAVTARKGIFEMAEGGTLLLDEIGELPMRLQAKLLSVLEDHKVKRLGGESFRIVDMRIIASTNIDLERAVAEKTFREDLFYRLCVLRIHVPPLRERKQDIPALCGYILRTISSHDIALSEQEVERLKEYYWPGNVRELKNIIERSLLLKDGPEIKPSKLIEIPATAENCRPAKAETDPIRTMEEVEMTHIRDTLKRFSGNIAHTANALGMSLSTLKRRLRSFR
ncbi:MAG: hypothetical protein BWK74_00995 [Desulfobacteraceae bacterium A6]|nr:MAG: hypothetical protein BWK74_00995 [Desulfobacteraceae bacterium A6]